MVRKSVISIFNRIKCFGFFMIGGGCCNHHRALITRSWIWSSKGGKLNLGDGFVSVHTFLRFEICKWGRPKMMLGFCFKLFQFGVKIAISNFLSKFLGIFEMRVSNGIAFSNKMIQYVMQDSSFEQVKLPVHTKAAVRSVKIVKFMKNRKFHKVPFDNRLAATD